MNKGALQEIVLKFSKEMIILCRELERARLHVVAKQLIRCATAIGAAHAEAGEAESADDFIHKMKIAMKESKETMYWLEMVEGSVDIKAGTKEQLTSIQKIIARSIATATHNKNLKRKK